MGYQIIRIEKRKTTASVRAMLRHALREDQPSNADPDGPRPHVLRGSNSSRGALLLLRHGIAHAPLFRKDSIPVVEFLVTGSPEDIHRWPHARQDQFFAEAVSFVASRFGGEQNILTACVHRDESTPHIQILIMPRDPHTGRFVASKMIGGPRGLRQLHDDFFERIGRRYGLARGERGTGAKHTPIRQFYARLSKVADPLPEFVEVPPAPTFIDRVQGKSDAIEAARRRAIDQNKKADQERADRAKSAQQIHPKLLERRNALLRKIDAAAQARESEVLAATAKVQQLQQQIQAEEKAALEINCRAQAASRAFETETRRMEALNERFRSSWICANVDRWFRSQTPEVRAAVGSELGIELTEGSIVKQVCRLRRLSSAVQAVELIEMAMAKLGLGSVHLGEGDELPTDFREAHGHWG